MLGYPSATGGAYRRCAYGGADRLRRGNLAFYYDAFRSEEAVSLKEPGGKPEQENFATNLRPCDPAGPSLVQCQMPYDPTKPRISPQAPPTLPSRMRLGVLCVNIV
jgi:hypothetical protein